MSKKEKLCKTTSPYPHQNKAGITLVALAVTIILMLILAGIVFSLLLGEHGIIKMAQQAGKNYVDAQEEEKRRLEELYSSIFVATNDDTQINISVKDLKSLIGQEVQSAVEEMKNILKEEVQKDVSKHTIPVGAIVSQMGNTAPEGYLICDGTIYNIEQYKELAEYIQSQFGKYDYWGGDGQTTFAVPNLQGEFLRGYTKASEKSRVAGISTSSVGLHQEGTYIPYVVTRIGANGNGGQLFFDGMSSSSDNTFYPQNLDFIRSDSSNLYQVRFAAESFGKNTWSSSAVRAYMARPTNTSVLYCIKY